MLRSTKSAENRERKIEVVLSTRCYKKHVTKRSQVSFKKGPGSSQDLQDHESVRRIVVRTHEQQTSGPSGDHGNVLTPRDFRNTDELSGLVHMIPSLYRVRQC